RPKTPRRAKRVDVHTDAVADPSCGGTAVSGVEGDRAFGLARLDEDGDLDRSTFELEPNDVSRLEARARGERGAHERRVGPGEERDGSRELLEPGVVRESAVEDVGVGPKRDLDDLSIRRAVVRLGAFRLALFGLRSKIPGKRGSDASRGGLGD